MKVTDDCGSGLQRPERKRGKERDNMKELEGRVLEGSFGMCDDERNSQRSIVGSEVGRAVSGRHGFRSVPSYLKDTVNVDVGVDGMGGVEWQTRCLLGREMRPDIRGRG